MTALPDEAAEVFRADPDGFVAARNGLAARLAAEGRTDDAAAIKALRKPTVAVWALNQLHDRDAEGVTALLDAGAELRAAQQAALSSSKGGAERLRTATVARRAAVAQLVESASDALTEAGRSADSQVGAIAGALEVASFETEAGRELTAGTMQRLPDAPGVLRATRVEQRAPSAPILTGTVQNLDAVQRTFTLGGLVVDYARAVPSGSLDGRPLANGTIVRVRADAASPGVLVATLVQGWYPLPTADATTAQFAGIVTDFAGLGSLRVLGYPVDASAAQITGGATSAIGNGVKVDVGGVVSGGVLRASKLKIRHVPGTGGPASFDLIGNVGAFSSPSDFSVKGQAVNAGGPDVKFANGTAANLRNGVRVNIHGTQVVNGVLMAATVAFE